MYYQNSELRVMCSRKIGSIKNHSLSKETAPSKAGRKGTAVAFETLEYPLEYPDYATEVVEGGKYTYSFVLIPLAILGTAIVSMMPR
jgi:hypothetical protein